MFLFLFLKSNDINSSIDIVSKYDDEESDHVKII